MIKYDQLVEDALREVVKKALEDVVSHGLSGDHHFYITFTTDYSGVILPDYLRQQYPDEMTIVIQHRYFNLKIHGSYFSIQLSFNEKLETLVIPFGSIITFADPSVNFALQFQVLPKSKAPSGTVQKGSSAAGKTPEKVTEKAAEPTDSAAKKPEAQGEGNVVQLDRFRQS